MTLAVNRMLFRSLSALMALTFVGTFFVQAVDAAPIQINIKARTSTGEPLDGIPVSLTISPMTPPVCDARTDAQGDASLSIDSATVEKSLWMRYNFTQATAFTKQEQYDMIQRMNQIQERYALDAAPRIELKPDQFVYEVQITAWPAIEISAVVVDPDQQPKVGRLFGPKGSFFGWSEAGKQKPLGSVRQGQPLLVVATSNVSAPATILKPIAISAEQARENVDLGSVVIPPLLKGVPIHAMIDGDQELRKTGLYAYRTGLTFISIDGSLMVSYEGLDGRRGPPKSDGPVPLEARGGQPTLPPGRYFVVPGWIMTGYTDDHAAVLSALLDGADLKQSKIPQIEVKDGGDNTFTINVLEAHQAIQAACAKSGEPTSKAVTSDGARRSPSQ